MDDKPNLDLIGMVQQARMAHDADARPSQVSAVYWIEAKARESAQTPTPRAGHWLIRTNLNEVDALWAKVKAATEAGELGYKAKVSTASRERTGDRAIHIVTYDANDQTDVARVGDALRALGLDPLSYERE